MSSKAGGVRRIMRECKNIAEKPCREFHAYPLEDNVMEWHFTLLGPDDSPYEGGLYHGKILLPSEYPFAPPDVVLVTPNGRFELDKKICLSISSYHPENWHPTWGISTVLLALRDFMKTPGNNAIGAIEYPVNERKRLAKESRSFKCPSCGVSPLEHWETIMSKAAPTAESDKVNVPTPAETPKKAGAEETGSAKASPELKPQPEETPVAEIAEEQKDHPKDEVKNAADTEAEAPKAEQPEAAAVEAPPVVEEREPAQPAAAQAAEQRPPAPEAAPPHPARPQRRGVTLQLSLSDIDRALSFCFAVIFLILLKKAVFDYNDVIAKRVMAWAS